MTTKDKMRNIFERLADPQLVADLQKSWGVVRCPTKSKQSQNGGSGSSNFHGQGLNAIENGVSGATKKLHLRSKKSETALDKLFGFTKSQSKIQSGTESDSSSDDEQQKQYVIRNKLLYYIASFGASLGNEMFYIIFFPAWFWNIDGYVGRRICLFWAMFMYIGQAAKDAIKYPRPSSPPVVQLEARYSKEYGFPSTHAMIGGVPFCMVYYTMDRYIYPLWAGIFGALAWTVVVCFSRIYLGMHSVMDVVGGLTLITVLMAVFFPIMNHIDNFMLHSPLSPASSIIIPIVLSLLYPRLERWSTARGDTIICMASWSGVALGHWLCFQYGLMEKAQTEPPFPIIYPDWTQFGHLLMRLVIGMVILIATRALFKPVSKNVACWAFGIDKNDPKALEYLCIELPYKFCTYTTVAFNTVLLCPQVFKYLGIERPTFFTEI